MANDVTGKATEKSVKRHSSRTRQMTMDAMLAAVCVVLGCVGLNLGNNKITFESLPVLIAAMMFGPIDGMIVGAVGTFLSQMIMWGLMITTPLWIMPYVVCGLVVGLLAKKLNVSGNMKNAVIVAIVGEVVILLLNTFAMYADSKIMGYYTFVYVFGSFVIRAVTAVIKAVVYGIILSGLLVVLKKAVI